jgi:hypothetical protein
MMDSFKKLQLAMDTLATDLSSTSWTLSKGISRSPISEIRMESSA